MRFRIQVPTTLLVAIVVLGMTFSIATEASASYHGQWFGGSDGCIYQWNDSINDYHLRMCRRADGGADFWRKINGQWVFAVSAIQNQDGSMWVYEAGGGGWVLHPPVATTSIGGGGATGNPAADYAWANTTYNNNQILLNGGIRNCDYTYEC